MMCRLCQAKHHRPKIRSKNARNLFFWVRGWRFPWHLAFIRPKLHPTIRPKLHPTIVHHVTTKVVGREDVASGWVPSCIPPSASKCLGMGSMM